MEQIKFKYSQQHKMYFGESSSVCMWHLSNFLTDDVGSRGVKSWKEFIRDPKLDSVTSNYSSIEKEGDKITIGFEGDLELDNPVVFETNAEQLEYILDRWQEACEKKPKKIIITIDQGKANVEFED